ncbi:DUF4290 domain-containing protein [Dysgonomonas sp. 520]|uniref:DUF4290 domain-containing protein n=1 Tax=Dysgonomonas sp. 520 TaxID=2302931 RepID=UPI0013D7E9CA|nr:DUF4290 domain-containing protein [Dysgonomonas sp. 520]NDW09308.1 DUF4290 domain-containing protein [Dysgonomonas sp. 520]
MDYNTQLKKLALPEYGRNIQNMVDFCLTIEDRNERKRCANTIINIMGNMFPHLRDVNDFKHILWDHLAVMADFKLDIDYPYEIIKKEDLFSKPGKVDYSRPDMEYRHYGKVLEKMIRLAADYPEGDEKEQFVWLVANHMKKSYVQWNKEVEDGKIFQDLYELSNRKIDKRNSDMKLTDIKDLIRNNQKKNNNQKKK